MAITSKATLKAGMQRPMNLLKSVAPAANTRWMSSFYVGGIPAAAVAPTPGLAGAALTSYGGQIPFTNPVSGNAYLNSVVINQGAAGSGMIYLVDRLWHNSGIVVTTTTAQTVNSVAWPARDDNGSTNGEGVYIGVEVSGATGASAPTSLSMSYTNQAGTAGRTGANILGTIASAAQGSFWVLGLNAGDTGVRSIQTFTLATTWTSGTIHLVAFRMLAMIPYSNHTGVNNAMENAITLGMPRMYNDSVPFFLTSGSGVSGTVGLTMSYAHG